MFVVEQGAAAVGDAECAALRHGGTQGSGQRSQGLGKQQAAGLVLGGAGHDQLRCFAGNDHRAGFLAQADVLEKLLGGVAELGGVCAAARDELHGGIRKPLVLVYVKAGQVAVGERLVHIAAVAEDVQLLA